MTDNYPISPPPELFAQWENDILNERDNVDHVLDCAWRNGFQAGADQELEACVSYVDNNFSGNKARALRALRRPKPPSLKETLLARVARIPGEGADAAYLRHWVDNESQRLVDVLHEVFKSLPS